MVEFAILLPLLALLLVIAVDFGRVFFGWVGVHNAVRIAANAAGSDPGAWEPPGNTAAQNRYREAVLNELNVLGCVRVGGGAWTANDVPDPVFRDMPSSFSTDPYEVGDHATVTINCEMQLITPLAGAIVGSPFQMAAYSEFPVRGGTINGIPIGNQPPPPGCLDQVVPNLVGLTVANARTSWSNAGFTGAFDPATGSDTDVVSAQVTSPTFQPGDCAPATTAVTVTHAPAVTCSGTEIPVPNLVGLTLLQARSAWTGAGFDSGTFNPASGDDSNVVTGQNVTAGTCEEPDTTVTVTHEPPPPPQCTMPQLIGNYKVNSAETPFRTEGFTGAYIISRPPQGNYDITSQSLVGGQDYDCTSGVTVGGN